MTRCPWLSRRAAVAAPRCHPSLGSAGPRRRPNELPAGLARACVCAAHRLSSCLCRGTAAGAPGLDAWAHRRRRWHPAAGAREAGRRRSTGRHARAAEAARRTLSGRRTCQVRRPRGCCRRHQGPSYRHGRDGGVHMYVTCATRAPCPRVRDTAAGEPTGRRGRTVHLRRRALRTDFGAARALPRRRGSTKARSDSARARPPSSTAVWRGGVASACSSIASVGKADTDRGPVPRRSRRRPSAAW